MSNFNPKILLSIFLLMLSPLHNTGTNTRDIFEIIFGGGRGRSACNCSDTPKPTLQPPPTPQLVPQASQPSSPLPPKASPSAQNSLVFADKRLALVYPVIQNFKTTITSDPFGVTKSWVGPDICNYTGFYCDQPPDNNTATALASIDFNGYQLAAPTLDSFLDQLPDIALFHANSNNFSGTISPNIAKLKYLYELDISNNKFSGPFPSAVLGMDTLTFLDIRFNSFSGSVPPQIFTQGLYYLFLNNNDFMAQLPDNLGSTHIILLTLANNKFVGSIPYGIAKAMSGITEVLFLNNMLSGCLPYEIGLLKEARVFDAGNNRLTGPLPFSLGCLEKVEQLNIAGNRFYGMVPEIVCQLRNLVNLSLSDNYFIHVGPVCRRLIWRGVLDIRTNCIPDLPFQRSVAECSAFFSHLPICPYGATYSFIPCTHPHYFGTLP